jgi:sulfide:quinone oxidoreductase
MQKEQVIFSLAPIYKKHGIEFKQARAVALYPEGRDGDTKPAFEFEWTTEDRKGQCEFLSFDYLINASGPR